ncbi:hypothetical protein [Streptomyces sp. NPDC057554]|uniref:hypothetical protein n=1 Tax=Streptomyces sp. NPDC057554 TaxID=3350538 RepID=UPI003680AE6A
MSDSRLARPSVVPYVTAWDSERAGLLGDLVLRRRPQLHIAYADERPDDRDDDGVLIGRISASPGQGRALYREMHVRRQYECMTNLLCQICGEPASENTDGVLFLDWRHRKSPATWPERSLTKMPPLCEPCAVRSIAECPHLANEPTCAAIRTPDPRAWGVSGSLYRPVKGGWYCYPGTAEIPYGDFRLHAMVSSALMVELTNVTRVSVEDLAS